MHDGAFLVLTGHDVESLLVRRESELIEVVRAAYEAHWRKESSLPQSTFLRFPGDDTNRIVALPAYLAGEHGGAGIKWISSFPGNVDRGIDRASAVVILNSVTTGRPVVMMEGSVISAKRTAASAALAALTLHRGAPVTAVGAIGCGVINLEIQTFLQDQFPSIERLFVHDLNAQRAAQFARAYVQRFPVVDVTVMRDATSVLRAASIVSLATTAAKPHITDLSGVAPGTTILHVSLRDLGPEVVLACDNIVDDVEHVCRAETSLHLAEQLAGTRSFIRCVLAEVMAGQAPARADEPAIAIFSPFGLGVLDIAVGAFIHRRAIQERKGTWIDSFFPDSFSASSARPVRR
jgi:N-[(2S)-2-amino-2-carboxyethyl]-L-glutamate dehydrogenase